MSVDYNNRVITVELKRRDLIRTLIYLNEIMKIGGTDRERAFEIYKNLYTQLDEYDNKHREELEA